MKNIWIKANKLKFEAEIFSVNELLNTDSFDHALYHIDEFGRDYDAFEDIEYLFE